MKNIDLSIPKGAVFFDDRKYRYALWRNWSLIHKPLMIIGLNPSTANELSDDPTITRLIARASREGFGGILMANLYAYVTTNPDRLLEVNDSIGAENDNYIKQMARLSDRVICGWGSFPATKTRANDVLKMILEPYCLGINQDGNPKHPLYVSYDKPMIKYTQV